MDDTTLIQRLGGLEPPRLDEARESAVAAVQDRLRAAAGGSRRERQATHVRAAVALVAAALVLTAFAVLTPPGRAFTSWVGERIGLGEPGGHPTLQSLRHFATSETAAAGQPAYVLVSGPVPGGGRLRAGHLPQPARTGKGMAGRRRALLRTRADRRRFEEPLRSGLRAAQGRSWPARHLGGQLGPPGRTAGLRRRRPSQRRRRLGRGLTRWAQAPSPAASGARLADSAAPHPPPLQVLHRRPPAGAAGQAGHRRRPQRWRPRARPPSPARGGPCTAAGAPACPCGSAAQVARRGAMIPG